MCGIVGLVHRDRERPVHAAAILAMCDTIRHRGPDDEGVCTRGAAGLGARRLSIIDVAGGHQPITSADGSTTIAFNGEVYNYAALGRDLASRGALLRTRGDTEVVLEGCRIEGAGFVSRLRGMFAFALWNHDRRTLLLARDRFGIKPLYYAVRPWGIAFASELKVFVRNGLTCGALDRHALDAYLELGYVPAPLTPFEDVRKLEPGHMLSWRDGLLSLRRYWDLPTPAPEGAPLTVSPDCVRHWIDDSVAAHLVSDVPVAAFLSGGLDSSTVVASAARHGPIHAYTARYHGSGAASADESDLARLLAKRSGAELTIVDVRPDVASTFERIVEALDEPLADDSAIPTWTMAEVVGRQYKVALTGTGGDELFAGYRRHAGARLFEWYRRVPAVVRRGFAVAAGVLRDGNGRGLDRARRFLAADGGTAAEGLLSFVSRLRGPERAALYASTPHPNARSTASRLFAGHAERAGATDALTSALYLDYKTFLPDDILALSDRISMAHGLELRVPFVDHELVERVYPLPAGQKLGWGRTKRLLRKAMRDRLPAAHFGAPKRGFVGPTAAWLRRELRWLLQDELSADRMRRLGIFKSDAVQHLVDDHLGLRRDREGILWALLTFSTWHRVYVEGNLRDTVDPVGAAPAAAATTTAR